MRKAIDEAVAAIRARCDLKPEVGIILGTGLGGLAREIEVNERLPYPEVPGFLKAMAEGHRGELVLGHIGAKPIVAMEGRYHLYEGYTVQEITLPVRVMKALGARGLIVSNASGGMNPIYRTGDLVLIDDHINLMGVNPLIGPNDDTLGPRFPDMSAPYDAELLERAEQIAMKEGIRTHRGVYVALIGPSLETRAEYRFLRATGADCVGMSTVPEVLVAVHAGLRILGISVITDLCFPEALKPVVLEEVLRLAAEAEPKLTRIVMRLVQETDW